MASWRRIACLLALALLVSEAACAKPKPTPSPNPKPSPKPASPNAKSPSPKPKPSPSPKPKCINAIDQLADYNTDTGAFSKWYHSVVHSNSSEWLVTLYNKVQAQAGPNDNKPALIMPSNAAFDRYLAATGFPANSKRWNRTAVDHFRAANVHLVVPWRMAKNHWPKYFVNCTLLGLTQDMSNPLKGMNLQLWNGKGPGLVANLRVIHKVPPGGRRLAGSATTTNYGVVGQGYNTLVGFPNSYSAGGVDPGFTGFNIFNTIPSSAQPMVTSVGVLPQGECSTSFVSSALSTADALYSSSAGSLGASANYGGASFSSNYNYNSMTQVNSAYQESSFISSGTSTLGGYSIDAAAPVLDPYYVEAVQILCSAYLGGESEFQSELEMFAQSYGSSFVQQFYYGGYAATVMQMSSNSYSTLQTQAVSLSAAASVTFIEAGGSVSGSYDGDMSVAQKVQSVSSTFEYVQIPSSTVVALTSSGGIDCTTWTENLQTAADSGILSPMIYQINNQSAFLSGAYWYLFPEPCTQSVLQDVAAGMVEYFSSCSNSQVGCPPPGTCPEGSFKYSYNSTDSTCVYCYDQNNSELSPMCNPANTVSCGYQSCTCTSGYTAASQCNEPTDPTAGGSCVAEFTGYGCENFSNDCTEYSTPQITYCQYTQTCSCNCCVLATSAHPENCAGSSPPACNPPPPPPNPPPSCFPGAAQVQVEGQGFKLMAEVSIGDKVLAADAATGALSYQSVYLIPHREADVEATYVNLAIAGKASPLQLSPRHFIPVCTSEPCSAASNWETRYARDIKAGDKVRVVDESTEVAAVQRTWLSVEQGAFNPFVVGGTVVVNGVLASDQSEWILDDLVPASMVKHLPAIYASLVAPARWAFWALGAERWSAVESALGVSWVGHNFGTTVMVHAPLALGLVLAASKVASHI